MAKWTDSIQPAVKTETKRVMIYTEVGLVLMWVVFFILHQVFPEKVPFDYTVILGGLVGGAVAVLNFFLMGLTVQKVAATEDETNARNKMRASYTQRNLMQVIWAVIAILAPCFQFVAGLVPLLIPGTAIKLVSIFRTITGKEQ